MAIDRDALSRRLMALFLGELEEHERTLERDLLALERMPPEDERRALIEGLFRAAHSLKGAARAVNASTIESVCHRLEHELGELRAQGVGIGAELIGGLLTQVDAVKVAGARLRAEANAALPQAPPSPSLALPPQPASPPPKSTADRPEPVPPAPAVRLDAVPARPSEPRSAPAPSALQAESPAARVATLKLDALLATSGDLMVANSRAEACFALFDDLHDEVQQLLRREHRAKATSSAAPEQEVYAALKHKLELAQRGLARELGAIADVSGRMDEAVRRLRMTPFQEACEGLERSVRDLSKSLGKEVRLVVVGGAVELDRELVQRLRDPLLHLLRNALSHGIEPPELRRARAKPPVGEVVVSASIRGSTVEISVGDDGGGLALDVIRERALALGLPDASDADELASYVFAPGLSTARAVDEIAGRGVGLDAVKRSIEALHGSVNVRATKGVGTRFTLLLPVTLSKMRCAVLSVAGQRYAIPSTHLVRALRFRADQVMRIGGNELVRAESELVPLTSLARLLGLTERVRMGSEQAQAVVLSNLGRSVALIVQELVGDRDCVVRKLPPRLASARYVSGGTVLSDGHVALVLNGSELAHSALAQLARPSATVFTQASARRRRILVADDSVTTRTLIKSIIEEGGYDVTAARDGSEALRLLTEQPFDLVVSDVQMPNMDGFTLTAEIRRSPKLARLPVVLITSLESDADRLRGLEAGANAYLGKSVFDHVVLLQLVGRLL